MEEHAVLNVDIRNFKRIKPCPYCGEKPTQMKWSDGKIEMWCRNLKCPQVEVIVEEEYGPEDLDLVALTKDLIHSWADYCRWVKRNRKWALGK